MSCDCSRLAYGARLMLPLECKTILGPFNRPLVLTDVVFDLWTYPNGAASKACGSVWNVLPNQWSRLLVGGWVALVENVTAAWLGGSDLTRAEIERLVLASTVVLVPELAEPARGVVLAIARANSGTAG